MAITTRRTNYDEMTREELYELAQEHEIEGRSDMTKDQLAQALRKMDLGPDAVQLLIGQHRDIMELFERFEESSSRPSQKKDDLVRDMITNLVRHAEIEEQIFYPTVAAEMPDLEDDVQEDLEEHHVVEVLLWELDHMTSSDERFDAKVKVLIESVRHHVEEEERELLPRVQEELDDDTRRRLGGAMREAWGRAPERPHPLSPDTPPGNVLMAIPGAVIDRTVNTVRWVFKTVRR